MARKRSWVFKLHIVIYYDASLCCCVSRRSTLLEKVHFFTEDVHIELDENTHLIFQPYIPISFAAAAAAVCVSIIWAKIAHQTKNSFSQHGASFPNSFQKILLQQKGTDTKK